MKQNDKALNKEVTVKDRLIKVLRSKNLKLNQNVKKMEQDFEAKRVDNLNQKFKDETKKIDENDVNISNCDFEDFYDCERASLDIEIKERSLRLDLESLMNDLASAFPN